MDSFPSSFSFSNASARYKANRQTFHDELASGRKYIHERYEKCLAAGKEYYTINLEEFTGPVKTTLICELYEKFPHIGYKGKEVIERKEADPPTNTQSSDPYSSLFANWFGSSLFTSQPTSNNTQKKKRHKIVKMSRDRLDTSHNEYVIAITQNFADTMATGTW